VVRVSHKSGKLRVLHSFSGSSGGTAPWGRLTYHNGLFYGATFAAANAECNFTGCGTIFAYDPGTGGLTTLYTFTGTDGWAPNGGMIYEGGFFYGVTSYGGAYGNGTVFRLDVASGAETPLYSFAGGPDGRWPGGTLTLVDHNIYGSTTVGGKYNAGILFVFDLKTGREKVLFNFAGRTDGAYPNGGLLLKDGVLYGTTSAGGNSENSGVVFRFDLNKKQETVLYRFTGSADGASPQDGLLYKDGAFFGTTLIGGNAAEGNGAGTIFKFVP